MMAASGPPDTDLPPAYPEGPQPVSSPPPYIPKANQDNEKPFEKNLHQAAASKSSLPSAPPPMRQPEDPDGTERRPISPGVNSSDGLDILNQLYPNNKKLMVAFGLAIFVVVVFGALIFPLVFGLLAIWFAYRAHKSPWLEKEILIYTSIGISGTVLLVLALMIIVMIGIGAGGVFSNPDDIS